MHPVGAALVQTDRQRADTDRQMGRHRQTDGQTDRHRQMGRHRQTDGQTDRQTDRQTGRQRQTQTDRRADMTRLIRTFRDSRA